jgi:DNA-binding MarR family transcriptional regulator
MPASAAISSLDSHLGYQLRIVSNAVSYSFARKMEAKGVTVAEWVFLRVLHDVDRLAPTELAQRMGMSKGAISKLADRLAYKGLVRRMANPDDGRAHTLALTAKARPLVPRLAKIADANDAAFFGELTANDRTSLGRILKKITDIHELKDVPTE